MEGIIAYLAPRKEFLGTTVVVIASILFLGYFGESERLAPAIQGAIVAVGVFLVIPVLYCKIVLSRPLSALGFQRGNMWAGIGGSILAIGVGVVALFGLWHFTPLLADYRLPVIVEEQFLFFVLYEVVLSGSIVLMYEVFFRGLVLLLWLRHWGFWAVLAQAILFIFLFYASHDIQAQTIPVLLFSPLAGMIAYQSRSLLYSFAATWFFLFLTDALMLILR